MKTFPLLLSLLLLGVSEGTLTSRVDGLIESTISRSFGDGIGADSPASLFARALPKTPKGKWRFDFGGPTLGGDTLYGVGLGGWLVLESFITPSLFQATGKGRDLVFDEWTLSQSMDKPKVEALYRKHYDTFITEDDFVKMKDFGLNAVRIPIPFWAFDVQGDEPYLKLDQWDKFLEACTWAQKHGIKVVVDLHTVPGGQNGNDHSGRKGVITWHKNPQNKQRTLDIIKTMAIEFSKAKWADTVIGIGPMNEPRAAVDEKILLQFYKDAYREIRSHGNLAVIISDTFHGPGAWNDTLTYPEYEGLIIDTHIYYIFTENDLRLPDDKRRFRYCSRRDLFADINKNHHWVMVGEWSPTFTDCAISINGRDSGSRYDGSFIGEKKGPAIGSCDFQRGPASNWSKDAKRTLAKMWEYGMDSYYTGVGGFVWTWKTEAGTAEDLSYVAGVDNGWIPRDPMLRPAGFHCNGAATNSSSIDSTGTGAAVSQNGSSLAPNATPQPSTASAASVWSLRSLAAEQQYTSSLAAAAASALAMGLIGMLAV